MKYNRFEDLPVWQASQELAIGIYLLTDSPTFPHRGDLVNQLQRSSLSISSNIAEGFERGSTTELIAFLYIARGSAGEARSQLHFAQRLLAHPQFANPKHPSDISNPKSDISNLKSEISNLISLAENCSRQIRGWADSLQNTDIKGQRHLNDQTRATYDNQRRAAAFMEKLKSTNGQNDPNFRAFGPIAPDAASYPDMKSQ